MLESEVTKDTKFSLKTKRVKMKQKGDQKFINRLIDNYTGSVMNRMFEGIGGLESGICLFGAGVAVPPLVTPLAVPLLFSVTKPGSSASLAQHGHFSHLSQQDGELVCLEGRLLPQSALEPLAGLALAGDWIGSCLASLSLLSYFPTFIFQKLNISDSNFDVVLHLGKLSTVNAIYW